MAQSQEAALTEQPARIALPSLQDVIDLVDRAGETVPFDASYGETLAELLPRRLSELVTRH